MLNNRGHILIFVLLFSAFLFSSTAVLLQSLRWFSNDSKLHYYYTKMHYAAESGFVLAESVFSSIPEIRKPDRLMATWFDAHKNLAYTFSFVDDVTLYAYRTPHYLYVTARTKDTYQATLRKKINVISGAVVLTDWEDY